MTPPAFTVCIPNFNYENYLGETLDSVLGQRFQGFEIKVSDNASTDGSVALIERYRAKDARIALHQNRCNVGFAGNLGKAAAMATGRFMLMLSSDDLMDADALSVYHQLFSALGDEAEHCVLSSATTIVDSQGQPTGEQRIDWKQWKGAVRDEALSQQLDAPVYVMDAPALLRNSLLSLRVPFYFLSTAYPKALHDAVEGYSQGGLFNPDKRFAWALLGQARKAYFIDKPLFRYRVHQNNQAALQAGSGALKHLVDEYVATFSLSAELLATAGVTRKEVVKAFVEHDIALRGFKVLAEGNRRLARRMVSFGEGCYPQEMAANRKVRALKLALLTGAGGTAAAKLLQGPAMQLWQRRQSANTQPKGAA